jgi:hypothetical protein
MNIDNFYVNASCIVAVVGGNTTFALPTATAGTQQLGGSVVRLVNEGASLVRFAFGGPGVAAISTVGVASGGSPSLMPGASEVFSVGQYNTQINASGPTFIALKCDGAGTSTVSISVGEGT